MENLILLKLVFMAALHLAVGQSGCDYGSGESGEGMCSMETSPSLIASSIFASSLESTSMEDAVVSLTLGGTSLSMSGTVSMVPTFTVTTSSLIETSQGSPSLATSLETVQTTATATEPVSTDMQSTAVQSTTTVPSGSTSIIPSTTTISSGSVSVELSTTLVQSNSTSTDSTSTVASGNTSIVPSTTTISSGSVSVEPSTTIVQSNSTSTVPSDITSMTLSTTISNVSSISMTTTMTPTIGPSGSIFDELIRLIGGVEIFIAVAVGGSIILILLCVIIIICCCCCCCYCCRRKYSVESYEYDSSRGSNGNVRGTRYRPSISAPQQSYRYELKRVKEEREKLEVFAETELNDIDVDDALHYQGHSQVQHSQQVYEGREMGPTTQSLSKLTPMNPSQMMSQAQGGISVDDDDEDYTTEIPEKEKEVGGGSGGDSPFMHLSDNLPPSRGRSQNSQNRSGESFHGTPPQTAGEASQYSHLGLGVLHGSDVVYTNTNSMMDDPEYVRGDVGMVGINQDLLASSRESSSNFDSRNRLIDEGSSNSLDDTPSKEQEPVTRKISNSQLLPKGEKRDFALLTSLESSNTSKISNSETNSNKRTKSLSRMTTVPSISTSYEGPSSSKHSDLQATPEKHRSQSLSSPPDSFRRSSATGKVNNSRLGKLTSLEYIRASLRMKLKKMTANKEANNSPEATSNNKKPPKSALRKTNSTSSYDSNASNTHVNPLALEYDESPQHVLSPRHHYPQFPPPGGYPPHPPHDYMEPYNSAVGGYLPPPTYVPLDPYGYPITSPHMVPMGPVYTDQLSPILSVSQYDYHPGMRDIGILPQYGGRPMPMPGRDNFFPSQPPNFDDEDDDDIPYRYNDMNVNASQRSVRWKLEQEIIPSNTPEQLTPSDNDDDDDR